jgi:hypothetical protein
MAKFRVPYHCPLKFELERFAMNGMVPNPSALRRLADGFNHLICVQKKQVFAYSGNWASLPTPASAASILWPVAFRTGRGTTGIIVRMGLVKSDFGAVTTPSATILVIPLAGGGTVASEDIFFNQRASGSTIVPDEVNHQAVKLTGLDPDTEYKLEIQAVNGARPVYCSVWERLAAGVTASVSGHSTYTVDDTDADICNPGQFEAEGDLLDTGIQKLVTASNGLIKQSRMHLLSYTGTPYEQVTASGVSINGSTSYVRVVGHTFNIDTSTLTTIRRSGTTACPVRLAVCSDRTSGTGTLSVGIYDVNAAAVVAEITGIGDSGVNNWAVASEDLPAQDGVYEIHAKQSNGTTTHILYGLSMWTYEA